MPNLSVNSIQDKGLVKGLHSRSEDVRAAAAEQSLHPSWFCTAHLYLRFLLISRSALQQGMNYRKEFRITGFKPKL